ncbi:MAG: hypothetical protein Q9174_002058 [Haloplaca sp. 1 TL-2023]
MSAQVAEYEELLQSLNGRVGQEDYLLIQATLDKYANTGRDDHSASASSRKRSASTDPEKQESITEDQATGRVGSTESLDLLTEDLNRSSASRASGFLGKNSEITWMEQLRRQTDDFKGDGTDEDDSRSIQDSDTAGLPNESGEGSISVPPLTESTYHCDSIPLEIPDHVQAYQLPSRNTADSLLSCYLECVHPAFPILGKTTFIKQYQAFYENPNSKPRSCWSAILNLIFAIAARYRRLAHLELDGHVDDDHTYFCRARLLGVESAAVWDHAEMQRIQVTGLTCFYLMATNHISR